MCVHSNRTLSTFFVTVTYSLVPPVQLNGGYARKHIKQNGKAVYKALLTEMDQGNQQKCTCLNECEGCMALAHTVIVPDTDQKV